MSRESDSGSPIEGYEQRLADRRVEAVEQIKSDTVWWLVLHVFALISLAAGWRTSARIRR